LGVLALCLQSTLLQKKILLCLLTSELCHLSLVTPQYLKDISNKWGIVWDFHIAQGSMETSSPGENTISAANNELQIKSQLSKQEKGWAQASTSEDQVNSAWTKVGKSALVVWKSWKLCECDWDLPQK
jgi:hypothetical protein